MARIPSALMTLWFGLFAVISAHFFLDDIGVTTATSERTYAGNPVFIVLDIFCVTVCLAGVAVFTSLFWASLDEFGERWRIERRRPRVVT
jgi:hypothetical protein